MIVALLFAASFPTPEACLHIGPLYWEIGDQRGSALDHVLDIGLLLLEQQVFALADHEGANRHERGKREDHEK